MITVSQFQPAWWLANAHAQTMFATLTRAEKAAIDCYEKLELPDGDFIDLAWSTAGLPAHSPLVILLHGLAGNVYSNYVAGQMSAYNRHGWRALLMHFRGAGAEPNRLARAYHSGDTADFHYLLQQLQLREPNTLKAVVGISMGGNILLKWLGENAQQELVSAAVAVSVSVPYDLRLVADRVNQGFSRFYQRYLLKKMRFYFARKMAKQGQYLPVDDKRLLELECFWTFDEYVTAPLHGFSGVHDYYRRTSSRQYLQHIATPTLLLHAKDDPFMTPAVIPNPHDLSSTTTLELSAKGGHVGFISGHVPGKPVFWLDQRIPEYLQGYLAVRTN